MLDVPKNEFASDNGSIWGAFGEKLLSICNDVLSSSQKDWIGS